MYRNRRWAKISSDDVLPGELVSIKSAGTNDDTTRVPCDLVLVRGRCIVDESMLTGESVPQPKVRAFYPDNRTIFLKMLRVLFLVLVAYTCLSTDLAVWLAQGDLVKS